MEIITKRPQGMSFENYKALRKINQKQIKKYLTGRLVFSSWKIKDFAEAFSPEKDLRIIKNPKPFRGVAKELNFI